MWGQACRARPAAPGVRTRGEGFCPPPGPHTCGVQLPALQLHHQRVDGVNSRLQEAQVWHKGQ